MLDLKIAKLVFANAFFGITEKGQNCICWSYPPGISGSHMEVRAVLDGSRCVCAEERKVEHDGKASAWNSSSPHPNSHYPQVVTCALEVLDSLGIQHSDVIGKAA